MFLLPSFYSRESFTWLLLRSQEPWFCFSLWSLSDTPRQIGNRMDSSRKRLMTVSPIMWASSYLLLYLPSNHVATLDKILSSLFVSCSPSSFPLFLFLSTPSMYHRAQLFVLKHLYMWLLSSNLPRNQWRKRLRLGSCQGTPQLRPWNLAKFIVICEMCLVDLELELAKAQMQCCFHDLLLVAFKLCNVWTDEWWSALLDD